MSDVLPIEDQLAAQALDIALRMERLAEEGDWDDIPKLASSLRDTVLGVPEEDRRALLLKLKRSNDQVESIVRRARREIEEQLSGLRVGRDATRAYQATNDMASGT